MHYYKDNKGCVLHFRVQMYILLFRKYKTLSAFLYLVLTLKRVGGVNLTLPPDYSKIVFSREKVKPCFFVTFNIITSHIFPENFIKIPQLIHIFIIYIWRFYSSIWTIFINFFEFFDIYLVTKKLMTSAYNRQCQNFFCL